MLKLLKQQLKINDRILSSDVSLQIEAGEHVALLGVNGIGKTTLLHELVKQNKNIAILEQDISQNIPAIEFIMESHPTLLATKQALQLNDEAIYKYIELDGYTFENEAIMMMQKFQFQSPNIDQLMTTFSGGERTKLALIKMLLSKKSIFIFDEPTNHLDNETKNWLIKWINNTNHTIFYTSHDRHFINETAHYILELNEDGLKRYNTNYDGYKTQKDIEFNANEALIKKENNEKKKINKMIQEFKEWHHEANNKASVRDPAAQKKVGNIAKKFKNKERTLLQKESAFKAVRKKKAKTDYTLQHESIKIGSIVSFDQVEYENDHLQLGPINLTVLQNEKIGIKGINGSGKSTLLKLITQELMPSKGHIRLNPNVKIGYFSQHLEVLNMNNTVLEEILTLGHIEESNARTILGSFRFNATRIGDIVSGLSMGEKCRLAFVKLYFSNASLLVLDEPTNYFDIEMQEAIEHMLNQYNGTIIIVSHDSYFLNAVVSRYLTIENGQLIDSTVSIENEIDQDILLEDIRDYLTLDFDK